MCDQCHTIGALLPYNHTEIRGGIIYRLISKRYSTPLKIFGQRAVNTRSVPLANFQSRMKTSTPWKV